MGDSAAHPRKLIIAPFSMLGYNTANFYIKISFCYLAFLALQSGLPRMYMFSCDKFRLMSFLRSSYGLCHLNRLTNQGLVLKMINARNKIN